MIAVPGSDPITHAEARPLPIVFEMETADPDDFLTLLWLADHPDVNLLGVTITPGTKAQCQLVRWGLDQCGRTGVPIGALHGPEWWDTAKGSIPRVSGFHYRAFGRDILDHSVGEVAPGPALLARLLRATEVTVLCGSAPKSLGKAFEESPEIGLARWVQQGGFAGDNLVAHPLREFQGRTTCQSYNLNGAWRETLALLASRRIERRLFVSKNVCHGVIWNDSMRREFEQRLVDPLACRVGLTLMHRGLDQYAEHKGTGKTMHDLVAAACALDERVCAFAEVEIYREKAKWQEWGAKGSPGTNTWISVGFNKDRFLDVLAR